MADLHETFESLKAPTCKSLQGFATTWAGWVSEGNHKTLPEFKHFDFLDWPDILDWLTVLQFGSEEEEQDRYTLENVRITYDGSKREQLFQTSDIPPDFEGLDQFFIDRWASIYTACIEAAAPIFAQSRIEGINRDYVRFEIGIYPFCDETGAISNLVSLIERLPA